MQYNRPKEIQAYFKYSILDIIYGLANHAIGEDHFLIIRATKSSLKSRTVECFRNVIYKTIFKILL